MSFDQLHEADSQRIRYKKISEHCGAEVSCKDILKGYENSKDKYVIVTDNTL
ncbi:Ku protein [Desulfosporosinus nitroreducens]|uniref:Ku protein n=1 Tax=Desulfosporosinus nitroreducens TaxID=2018668 RepID=UPI003457CF1F